MISVSPPGTAKIIVPDEKSRSPSPSPNMSPNNAGGGCGSPLGITTMMGTLIPGGGGLGDDFGGGGFYTATDQQYITPLVPAGYTPLTPAGGPCFSSAVTPKSQYSSHLSPAAAVSSTTTTTM